MFCADIGSVAKNNFGWYVSYENGATDSGASIDSLGTSVADSINLKRQVALGFEAPMFVPLRDNPVTLTSRRQPTNLPS